jgi:hypothetical protein
LLLCDEKHYVAVNSFFSRRCSFASMRSAILIRSIDPPGVPNLGGNMTGSVRRCLTFGIALLGAGGIVAVLPPAAVAEGGAGGSGTGTLTGPGGTTLGTLSESVVGTENVPGGAPGTTNCLSGGCSGTLTTAGSITTGGSSTPPPTGFTEPRLTVSPPNPIDCITPTGCHGGGTLSTSGSVQTPIIGASGGLNGFIHG